MNKASWTRRISPIAFTLWFAVVGASAVVVGYHTGSRASAIWDSIAISGRPMPEGFTVSAAAMGASIPISIALFVNVLACLAVAEYRRAYGDAQSPESVGEVAKRVGESAAAETLRRAKHEAAMERSAYEYDARMAVERSEHLARLAAIRADGAEERARLYKARVIEMERRAPAARTPQTATVVAPTTRVRRASDERRDQRVREAIVPGEQPTVASIRALRQGVCTYCGAAASHADHIRPVSRGGWHHLDNMVSACEDCNSYSKRSKLLVEWARVRPDLVLHGCERNENVLREYVYEMRHVTTLKFEYPATSDFVREACERHGFPELAYAQRTAEYALSTSRPSVDLESLPLPPIDSELTQPAIDDCASRQWIRIGERKAAAKRELVSA